LPFHRGPDAQSNAHLSLGADPRPRGEHSASRQAAQNKLLPEVDPDRKMSPRDRGKAADKSRKSRMLALSRERRSPDLPSPGDTTLRL
jgi:hypothetical protein